MLLLDSIFDTHHFHVSHLRMAQDELLIFGGLIISTNSYQTKNGTIVKLCELKFRKMTAH